MATFPVRFGIQTGQQSVEWQQLLDRVHGSRALDEFDHALPIGLRGEFGGGLWLAPITRVHTVSISIARGRERIGYYVKSGFVF